MVPFSFLKSMRGTIRNALLTAPFQTSLKFIRRAVLRLRGVGASLRFIYTRGSAVPVKAGRSPSAGLVLMFALLLATMPLAACTSSHDQTDIRMTGGSRYHLKNSETLRIAIETEPPTIDWNKVSDTSSGMIVENIMSGLVEFDLNDPNLKMIPSLAKSWVAKDSARTWVFDLRDDVKWSDGVPLTAQHVVDGFHRLLDPKTASDSSNYLFGVVHGQDYNEGKVAWDQVGIKVTGPHQVTIQLVKPMGYFPMIAANPATYPVRLDLIKKFGDAWIDPKNLVTLGPFRLRDWAHDKALLFDSNPGFFGGEPKIKHIVAYIIGEPQTSLSLFDAHFLDSVHHLPSAQLRMQQLRPEYRETSWIVLTYYGFNVEKPPMNDVRVRRAVIQAIDRREIVKILDGGQTPLSGWIPPGVMGFDEKVGLKFDPVKAKANLQAAMKDLGISSVDDFPRLEIRFNTSEDYTKIGENMQAQLKRNLGIKVELKNEEWKVYLNALKSDPPQIFRFGWSADYPDPDNFMQVMTSFSENNRDRWKNKKYDALVAEAGGETNVETREKLYFEAQRILTEEDAAVIPLFSGVVHALVSDRVLRYPINHLDAYEYKDVELKQ